VSANQIGFIAVAVYVAFGAGCAVWFANQLQVDPWRSRIEQLQEQDVSFFGWHVRSERSWPLAAIAGLFWPVFWPLFWWWRRNDAGQVP
jgi:hypothetical protein